MDSQIGQLKYEQCEAFCLMKYLCDSCGKLEILWNSRDAVTPFMIGCSACDETMKHIDWRRDIRDPGFAPPPAMRIFVTTTEALARPEAIKYVDKLWDLDEYPLSERFDTKEAAVEEFVKQSVGDFESQSPHVMTAQEAFDAGIIAKLGEGDNG